MQLINPGRLRQDERGDIIIQFVLVMPIFLIIIFGSYEIWKLVHLKQSLEAATVQATRYLSVEGPYLGNYPYDWQELARLIVAEELANEQLLRDELASAGLKVAVDSQYGGRPACPDEDAWRASEAVRIAERAQFLVHSQLELASPVRIPFVTTQDSLTLSETHWHYLECGPNTVPTPTPEP